MKIQVEVDASGLVSGLKVATTGVDAAATAMRTGLKATGDAATAAGKSHEGLLGTLRAFKAEQVQQGRVAKFYASELTGIIPASAGASNALRGVLGAGVELAAGGGVLAVGFELAKVGIEAFNEKTEESQARAAELRAVYVKATDEIDKSFRAVRQSLQGELSAAGAAWQGDVNKTKDTLKELQNEIAEKTAKAGSSVWAQIKGGLQQIVEIGGGSGKGVNTGEDEEIAQMQKKQLAEVKALEDRKVEAKKLAGEEQKKLARSTALEVESIEAKSAGKIAEIRAALQTRLHQLEEQKDKLDPDGSGANRGKLEVAARRETDEQIRRVRVDEEQKTNETILSLQKPFLSEYGAAIRESELRIASLEEAIRRTKDQKEIDNLRTQIDAQEDLEGAAFDRRIALERKKEAELAAEREANVRKNIDKAIAMEGEAMRRWEVSNKNSIAVVSAAAGSLVHGFSAGIQGMITGTESLGQAMADLATGMLEAVLGALEQIAAEWVTQKALEVILGKAAAASNAQGNIAVAATGAAASQAAIPIVGPALALGAASAMIGALEGMALPLLSARGGFDIGAGVNPIVQLHEKEMVLPARIAEPLRQQLSGGGGRDGGVHLHIHGDVYDAGGVEALPSNPKFLRGMREARRNGKAL
jgi:hypothetical protein